MMIHALFVSGFACFLGVLPCESAWATVSRTPANEVIYSASFKGVNQARMKLVVRSHGDAAITSAGQVIATCRAKMEARSVPLNKNSLQMICRSPALALESEAIVLRQGDSRAVLRFGSWLHGYTDAVLSTHYDGSLKRRPKHFAPALATAR